MADVKQELYIPRKCSATNRIIGAKDHASVQINIGHVNEHGVFDGTYTTVALSGYIRKEGLADKAINRIAIQKLLMKDINKFRSAIEFVKTH